ncbi:hypothetical protein BDV98DRAFT_594011 [Pterulicium gracile]|uniref:Uncharacterized protein n=1 Tax=Pterulicium gracile TaxID=1884261 RepID=A0A5C3QQR6_9AGAR|nr:hypothetical protein BDV98DRAFT_594011 [Pterula gracilis]
MISTERIAEACEVGFRRWEAERAVKCQSIEFSLWNDFVIPYFFIVLVSLLITIVIEVFRTWRRKATIAGTTETRTPDVAVAQPVDKVHLSVADSMALVSDSSLATPSVAIFEATRMLDVEARRPTAWLRRSVSDAYSASYLSDNASQVADSTSQASNNASRVFDNDSQTSDQVSQVSDRDNLGEVIRPDSKAKAENPSRVPWYKFLNVQRAMQESGKSTAVAQLVGPGNHVLRNELTPANYPQIKSSKNATPPIRRSALEEAQLWAGASSSWNFF